MERSLRFTLPSPSLVHIWWSKLSHEIVSKRRIRLLCLQVVSKRKNNLLELANLLFCSDLVLSRGFEFIRSLRLSLLLNRHSLFENLVLLNYFFMLRLELSIGMLHVGLFVLERSNFGCLAFNLLL